MAEEKKMSKGQRRYAHSNKIGEKKKKPGEPNAEKKEASSEGADGKMMKKDAQGTPTASEKMSDSSPGAAPKADVMAGTDGIAVRHGAERDEMAARHAKEAHQMHDRHAKEHEAMIKKHQGDMQSSDILRAGGGEMQSGEAATGVATAGQ